MVRPLWQLLLVDPSDLTCDECFAVMEYYAEALAKGGADLLPGIIEYLRKCPHCEVQHLEALRRLAASQLKTNTMSRRDLIEAGGSDAEG